MFFFDYYINSIFKKNTFCQQVYCVYFNFIFNCTSYCMIVSQYTMKHISGASLIVLLCVLIHVLGIGSDNVYFHVQQNIASVILLVSQGSAYLLYPLLGWLADVHFTRYKFVRTAFVLLLIGCTSLVIVVVSNLLLHEQYMYLLYAIGGIFMMLCLFALGMFEATAVQFGMDQMLEDSSDKLSRFIQWYYWGSKLGRLIISLVVSGTLIYLGNCHIQASYPFRYRFVLVIGSSASLIQGSQQVVCVIVGIWFLVYYQKHFNIDQIGSSPWKLVYQVLKYAWQHKCPER